MTLAIEEIAPLDTLIEEAISQDSVQAVFALAPQLACLPVGEYAEYKTQLKEHFKRRLPITDLDKAIKDARKQAKRSQVHRRSNNRPVVVIGGQHRDVIHAALDALKKYNQAQPEIFVQNGQLVTIHLNEKKRPSIVEVTEHRMRVFMSRSADYMSVHETADDVKYTPVTPPLDVTRGILDLNPAEYPFPKLEGKTEIPIPRIDGTICQTPGYDEETGYYYLPGNQSIPPIPTHPTLHDVVEAVRLIVEEWLGDFPFVDNADRAAIVSMAITAVIRLAINGQVPLCLIDATKRGTGKSLLADAIGILATAKHSTLLIASKEEEELRKKITTALMQSPSVILMDNIRHSLESETLETTLIRAEYSDRILATNTNVILPQRAVWLATGNNIRVGGDMPRRCIKCRMDAKTDRPERRTGFKIEGGADGFLEWTGEHRGELVAAILTLYRYWHVQGCPEADIAPLGNFENWTRMLGGILQSAGIPGFLANLDEDAGNALDDVATEWAAFFEGVYQTMGNKPFTLQALAKAMLVDGDDALNNLLPGSLSKSYGVFRRSDGVDRDFANHLGYSFRARRDEMFGHYCLKQLGKDRTGKSIWIVEKTSVQVPPADNPAAATPPQEDAQQNSSLSAGIQGLINSARERGVGLRWDEEQSVIIVSNVDSDLRERYASVIDRLNNEDWQQLAQYVRSSPIMAREVAS